LVRLRRILLKIERDVGGRVCALFAAMRVVERLAGVAGDFAREGGGALVAVFG
jgi:hypothetical protein